VTLGVANEKSWICLTNHAAVFRLRGRWRIQQRPRILFVAGHHIDRASCRGLFPFSKEASLKRVCGILKMDLVNALQWPAMLVTVIAAWLIAAQRKFKRNWGFWLFLLSNVLWIAWGLHDGAHALVLLQICLAILNIRGAMKNLPSN
jgi:hypothetical protein